MATTEIWVLYSAFLSCILSDIGKVILSCNYRFTIAQKSVSVCVCVCVHVRVCGVCVLAHVCAFSPIGSLSSPLLLPTCCHCKQV